MRRVLIFVCLGLLVGCAADNKGNALFEALDQDQDGLVSFEEYGGDQNEFMAMDADGDGKLTPAELDTATNVASGDAVSSQLSSGDAAGSADGGNTLIEAGKDAGQTVTEKTPAQHCQEFTGCMQPCLQQCDPTDQLCAGQCQVQCQQQFPEGGPLYETLEGCLMQACGTLTDQAAIQICVLAAQAGGGACYEQASTCGMQGGSASCSDIYMCIIGCAAGDAQCQNNCITQGSSKAITDFGAWNDCLNLACGSVPDDQVGDCVNTAQDAGGACAAQTDACGVQGGGGTVGCRDTLLCMYGCPQGDQACQYQCQQSASQEGMDQLLAWDQCLSAACPGLEGDAMTECININQAVGGACYTQTETCGLVGTSTCNEIQTCIQGCADNGCAMGCIFNATADGQAIFMDLQGCLSDNCYQAGQACSGAGGQSAQCQKCQGDNCAEDIAKCQSHGAAGGSAWKKMDNFMPVEMNPEAMYRPGTLIIRQLPNVFLPFKKD